MSPFVAEILGTFLLILLGNGGVANVLLPRTKGHDGGWIVITAAWGLAVFVAVFVTMDYSGAHLNPAVTLGLAASGLFEWGQVPAFVLAQMLGAMAGQLAVWLMYKPHYAIAEDGDAQMASFCTAPAIRSLPWNLVAEIIGTFVLVFAVLYIAGPEMEAPGLDGAKIGLGALGALPVGLLVFGIGLSLGGPTGYAINPARDLGPRIVHALLPLTAKRDSDWGYAWVPVIGPCLGALIAAGLFLALGEAA
ncbi:MAG: aquaporin family protein [Bacteroidetes bacterium]|nr:MAG: aquaporin family protein [Bacteroidota bacterium]